ncbi:DUF4878 domain-containing protein [Dysgonomonas sp. 511]|uniref:DUF4878 domain-containing protein n=1 Tax=Dysgonomonas sp. 511 TaxID=2302930 RepID=UPI0013D8796B|nr:DUF4878 domain-containing protein [Dysgonomonas sp. 511]
MKKTLTISLSITFLVLSFISCGNKSKSGETENSEQEAAIVEEVKKDHPVIAMEKSIMDLIVDKKYRESYDLMIENGDLTGSDKEMMKQQASAFAQKIEQKFSKNGGVKEYAIEDIDIADDATKVNLKVNVTYNNGKTSTEKPQYIKKGDDWKRAVVVDNKKR